MLIQNSTRNTESPSSSNPIFFPAFLGAKPAAQGKVLLTVVRISQEDSILEILLPARHPYWIPAFKSFPYHDCT